MTALKEYERLESEGLWRANPDAQRRGVTVSFGKATLVIADNAGRALTHWSLPAIHRLNEGERPAIFAPDIDADETLEVEDAYMIDAIEKVRKTLLKARPKQGRLRLFITLGVVACIALLASFWLPGAIRQQTLAVVPDSKRNEIGASVLAHVQSKLGNRCQSPLGSRALEQLGARLSGNISDAQIVVLPSGIGDATALPGSLIVVDQDRVERTDDPNVTAGYILAASAKHEAFDPLGSIIDHAGLKATITLLTTGEIPDETLKSYADQILQTQSSPADPAVLRQAFDAAEVPLTPWLADLERRGKGLELEPRTTGEYEAILSDSAWIGLQGICDN